MHHRRRAPAATLALPHLHHHSPPLSPQGTNTALPPIPTTQRPRRRQRRRQQHDNAAIILSTWQYRLLWGLCFTATCLLVVVLQILVYLWLYNSSGSTSHPPYGLSWPVLRRQVNVIPDYFDMSSSPQQEQQQHQRLPVLVMGGSDGSGTRAVVQIIQQLGVTIVWDDERTLDVHAAEVFHHQGWPALIQAVWHVTHSANFEWNDLPEATRSLLRAELKHLLMGWNQKFDYIQRMGMDHLLMELSSSSLGHSPLFPPQDQGSSSLPLSHANQTTATAAASQILFGVKAPVSMLVLPVLTQVLGNVKFLHIVRDGRDIALSDNQSPVVKFYNISYPKDYSQRLAQWQGDLAPVRAMQLWNDWNLQVQEWGRNHVNVGGGNGNGNRGTTQHNKNTNTLPYSFDYMSVRSEDLLDPQRRFSVVQGLANYVGSSLTTHELCCLSKRKLRDMGMSGIVNEHNAQQQQQQQQEEDGKYLVDMYGKHILRTGAAVPLKADAINRWNHPFDQAQQWRRQRREGRRRRMFPPRRLLSLRGEQQQQQEEEQHKARHSKQLIHEFQRWNETIVLQGHELSIEKLERLVQGGRILEQDQFRMGPTVPLSAIQNTTALAESLLMEKLQVTSKDELQVKLADWHAQSVGKRYGKWQTALQNKTELSRLLHQQGKRGLQVFGYEPRQEWNYTTTTTKTTTTRKTPLANSHNDDFVCDETVVCE